MINFLPLIGRTVLLEKIPYPGVFEAQVLKVSTNEQFVKLFIPHKDLETSKILWEKIDQLKLVDYL